MDDRHNSYGSGCMVRDALISQLKGQRVLVFGLGRQGGGVGVAQALLDLGAKVRVSDQLPANELEKSLADLPSNIEVAVGGHRESDGDWADLVIKNPAVPYSHPEILRLVANGKKVLTEAAMVMPLIRHRTIGITGTRGKTTTTHLIEHLLNKAGRKAVLGGNIPNKPILLTALRAPEDVWLVLELSSFQLEGCQMPGTSPYLGVFTGLSPDHLNRYETMNDYAQAKANIFRNQINGDKAALFSDHPWHSVVATALQSGVSAVHVNQDIVANEINNMPTNLPGKHNAQNLVMAATAVAQLGLSHEEIAAGSATFHAVAYRLEPIRTVDGITYINDTTSTTPTALRAALEAMAAERFVLIVGGTTKHLPIDPQLVRLLRQLPLQRIWLNGTGTQELLTQGGFLQDKTFGSMAAAVAEATAAAHRLKANKVILSPGFASFGLFKNEFDRGDQFNSIVSNI